MKNLLVLLLSICLSSQVSSSDYYWVGGSGDWSDVSHWATTSGGSTNHNVIPGYTDDVYFDENSFDAQGQEVVIRNNLFVGKIDFSTVLNNPIIKGAANLSLNLHGSFILNSDMDFAYEGEINLLGYDEDLEIDLAGQVLSKYVTVNADGSYMLLDDIEVDGFFFLRKGGLNFNGFNLTCKLLNLTMLNNTLEMGDSKILVSGGKDENLNLNEGAVVFLRLSDQMTQASNSVLELSGKSPNMKIKGEGTPGFERIVFSNSEGTAELINDNTIVNALILNELEFNSNASLSRQFDIQQLNLGAGKTYSFEEKSTYQIESIVAVADCQNLISLKSSKSGSPTEIQNENGNLTLDYFVLKDVHAIGNGTFAVNNGSDLGNNDGWNINGAVGNEFYWIGNGGTWSDASHWSLSSGGTAQGCLPGPLDNVNFDQNSFTIPGEEVHVDLPNIFVNDITWNSSTLNPTFIGEIGSEININGSLRLEENMSHLFNGSYRFISENADNVVLSSGQTFYGNLFFDGSGEWTFIDDADVKGSVDFIIGNLNIEDISISMNTFTSTYTTPRKLNIRKSRISMVESIISVPRWDVSNLELELLSDESHIVFEGSTKGVFKMSQTSVQNPVEYNVVIFDDIDGEFIDPVVIGIESNLNKIDSLVFSKNGTIEGNSEVNVLRLAAGHAYQLDGNPGLKGHIFNQIVGAGTCNGGIITLESNNNSLPAKVKVNENVEFKSYHISGINILGPGSASAVNSTDGGANSNINFATTISNTFYWINNSGDWQDPSHWSFSSGGSPSGLCGPTSDDHVIFDENSFSLSNQIISSRPEKVRNCKNIIWTNTFGNPRFVDSLVTIYGSVAYDGSFINEVILTELSGIETHTITSGGQTFNELIINGTGEFNFEDDLVLNNFIHQNGTFSFNDITAILEYMTLDGDENKAYLHDSEIEINGALIEGELLNSFVVGRFPLSIYSLETVDAGTSRIHFTNLETGIYNRSSNSLYDVIFESGNGNAFIQTNTNTNFNRLQFKGGAVFFGATISDSLIGTAGKSYEFILTGKLQVNEYYQMLGNNCAPIQIFANRLPTASNILIDPSSEVLSNFVFMNNIRSTGNSNLYAGRNSINVNQSTVGWDFEELEDESIQDGFLGEDRLLCGQETFILNPLLQNAYESLTWQDGSSGPTFEVDEPGIYSATIVFDSACVIMDQIEILEPMDIDIGLPVFAEICEGETVTLVPGLIIDGADYTWSDGSTAKELDVMANGTYVLTVNIDECDFLDSIEVVVHPNPGLDLGPDLSLCEEEPFELMTDASAISYEWQDGSSNLSFSGIQEGIYWLEVTDENCSFRDSVRVEYSPKPLLELGMDTSICSNKSYELTPLSDGDSFLWQDGSNDPSLIVSEGGLFIVSAFINGCENRDSINIVSKEVSTFSLGDDISICEGQEVELQVPILNGEIVWDNGTDEFIRTINDSGDYWLQISENGCSFVDSINVNFSPKPELELGNDTIVCDDKPYTITPLVKSEGTLTWDDESTTNSLTIDMAGTYFATLGSGECLSRDSITIQFDECAYFQSFIPNVFSPNEDGHNDLFRYFFPPNVLIESFEINIFDRWGSRVFSSKDVSSFWDGRLDSNNVQNGVYTYLMKVSYLDDLGPDDALINGDVTVVH